MGPEFIESYVNESSSQLGISRKKKMGWRKKSAPYGNYTTPKPPITPVGRNQQEYFANAGHLHYDKDSNTLYWNDSPDTLHDEDTTKLGDINDIKEIAKNLTVVITKKLLKGEL